jgi:hypothetical protein
MKSVLISVPPIKEPPSKKPLTTKQEITSTANFNKIFSNLHVSITPQGPKSVSYAITYSSGQHEMFLQNGMISSYFLF